MTTLISPTWWDYLQVAPLTPWGPKLELKILPHLAQSIDSELMDRFWCSRYLNNCIDLPHMIGSLTSGATSSLVAENRTNKLSQLFEDRFWFSRCIKVPEMIGLFASGGANSLVAKHGTKTLSQLFEELQGSNSVVKLITPQPITWTYFELFWPILSNLIYFGTKLGMFGFAPLLPKKNLKGSPALCRS